MCSKKAFTLLELLIVLIVVSILSILILPGLSRKYQSIKFENYSYQVLGFLKLAQNQALKEGRPLLLEIRPERFLLLLDEVELRSLKVPDAYRINSELSKLEVFPSGQLRLYSDSEILGEGNIWLESRFEKIKIVIWPSSGNIFLQLPYDENI
jgi:prepilin-type N-terminal cleavage/methylation domain-containing protein